MYVCVYVLVYMNSSMASISTSCFGGGGSEKHAHVYCRNECTQQQQQHKHIRVLQLGAVGILH